METKKKYFLHVSTTENHIFQIIILENPHFPEATIALKWGLVYTKKDQWYYIALVLLKSESLTLKCDLCHYLVQDHLDKIEMKNNPEIFRFG